MAYNHNGVELLTKPASKMVARKKSVEHMLQTGNYAYVEEVDHKSKPNQG